MEQFLQTSGLRVAKMLKLTWLEIFFQNSSVFYKHSIFRLFFFLMLINFIFIKVICIYITYQLVTLNTKQNMKYVFLMCYLLAFDRWP